MSQDTRAHGRPIFILGRLRGLGCLTPVQLRDPSRLPVGLDRAVHLRQDFSNKVEAFPFGQLQHVPQKLLCCARHE